MPQNDIAEMIAKMKEAKAARAAGRAQAAIARWQSTPQAKAALQAGADRQRAIAGKELADKEQSWRAKVKEQKLSDRNARILRIRMSLPYGAYGNGLPDTPAPAGTVQKPTIADIRAQVKAAMRKEKQI